MAANGARMAYTSFADLGPPQYTVPLAHLRSPDVGRAGGKGASLGELIHAGAPVPPGFVVTTRAWDEVVKSTPLERWMKERSPDLSQRARTLITNLTLPQAIRAAIQAAATGLTRLAVRSSATAEDGSAHAWAGQLDTFLDVTPADLEARVLDCWASLFTERALVYRSGSPGLGLGGVGVAVVVQQMVAAEAAGVGFSVHPTTQESDLMMIQGSSGLGETVVSGSVRPDTWVVSKSQAKVVEEALTGGCLSRAQVLEYASLLQGIEAHYGRPMDTEWAWAEGRFHLLQARPITTLDPGYDGDFYDRTRDWKPNVRRPWNLFSAALFCHNLEHTARTLGLPPLPVMVVELGPRMAQVCLVPADEERLRQRVAELCREEPATVRAWLLKGLEKPQEAYATLEQAVEACAEAVTCGTQIPFQMLAAGVTEGELGQLAERCRQQSQYPWFMETVIPALLQAPPEEATLDGRYHPAGRFVLQRIDGVETVSFHADTSFVLARFNGARVPRSGGDEHRLHGSAAYPGLAEGNARIVVEAEHPGFEDGDVVISVNANPSLMGLLTRCSAMVTDEGGAACHAAILARELKKPCVMGTGEATTRIREGQRIRVDAFAQTVELL